MKTKKFLLLLIISIISKFTFAQLYINEFSQGTNNEKEFFEFIVVGVKTCTDSTADIRNWIFDDNNDWIGSGGHAPGFYRFKNVAQWANIKYGSIILVYNHLDKNTNITLADDPTDANNDGVYVLPINSTLLERSVTSGYSNATFTNTNNTWAALGLRNTGDVAMTIKPTLLTAPFHAIAYGSNRNNQTIAATINFSNSGNNTTYFLANNNPINQAHWSTNNASSHETPGQPNTPQNAAWINSMKAPANLSGVVKRDTITICNTALPYAWRNTLINTFGDSVATFDKGQCDTLFILHLYSTTTLLDSINQTICSNQLPYNWNGKTVNTTGTHILKDTTTSAVTGCDSITTLTLIVNNIIQHSINQAICSNQLPYIWNNKTVNTIGTHILKDTTISAVTGCDSITTLTLIVNNIIQHSINQVICSNQLPYIWNNKTVNTTGTHILKDTTTSVVTGCDSITTLTLVVNSTQQVILNNTICASQLPYNWNGKTVNSTGTHTLIDTAISIANCDSITILNLNVNATSIDTFRVFVCTIPYVFNNLNHNTTGKYPHHFMNTNGCDSTIILDLTVGANALETNINIYGCGSVSHNNQIYYQNTTLIDTFKNTQNCDSLYSKINIIIQEQTNNIDTITICQSESFNFNGKILNRSGIYHHTTPGSNGCDSTHTIQLFVTPKPQIILDYNFNKDYCIGDTLIIALNDQLSYSFNIPLLYMESNHNAAFLLNNRNTEIQIKGNTLNGCEAEETLNIIAQACCEVVIPNAFTPNNDGLNDIFKVKTPTQPNFFNLSIFNRFGNRVFFSTDINEGWNGNQSNRVTDVGTYFYIIEIECNGQKNVYKGEINLLR